MRQKIQTHRADCARVHIGTYVSCDGDVASSSTPYMDRNTVPSLSLSVRACEASSHDSVSASFAATLNRW